MRVFLSFKPPNGSLNKIHSKWTYSHTPHLSVVMYRGCLGDWYNSLGTQILGPKKHFSSFLFLVAFQKKHADVAINNFTKHLITSNWCKRKKYRQKGKKWEKKKRWSERRYCLQKSFHSFKYKIHHTNVHFLFMNSLRGSSLH